jgi:hypothetical protein
LALGSGCERDSTVAVDRNRPPETYVTQGPELSPDPNDPTDLFYRAHLFWRGEDIDGTISGFQYALDDTSNPEAWSYTPRTDSIFRFPVSELGTLEHLFLIRAVDNLGKRDPSPDTLRFESFTRANPEVRFVPDKVLVNGQPTTLRSGDTVAVFSDVKFVWTGEDEDGEVAGWESLFDTQIEPTAHERSDTTRTETRLDSDTHSLQVSAIDDAGARSTSPAVFSVHANLGTITTFDPDKFVAKLYRPWAGDTLVTRPVASDFAIVDTIPSLAVVQAAWSSRDPDTQVIRYNWVFGEAQGQTFDPDTSASTLSDTENPNVGLWNPRMRFFIRATDEFFQVERPRDTLFIPVGFQPRFDFENEDEGVIPINTPHRFAFTARDRDSDSTEMRFEAQFLELDRDSTFGPVPADSMFLEWTFLSGDTTEPGVKRLRMRGLDNTGLRYPSRWDTVEFRLGPPPSGPGEARSSRRAGSGIRPAWEN